ncbi:MAG TPA: hypothetical protein VJK48_06955 [Chlamydiales bacterium]|nr:hypothetical protein [Chlamydiales bacterium]
MNLKQTKSLPKQPRLNTLGVQAASNSMAARRGQNRFLNHERYKFIIFGLLILCGCSHISSSFDSLIAIHIQDRNGITETISVPEKLENYENVDFLSSQPYKKVLRVYKGDKKNHAVITSYYPNGTLAQYLEAKEMRANGYFREWFSNGQLKIEAIVIGGTADITPNAKKDWLFDGLCKVFDEQGNLVATIPYIKGSIEGLSTSYYPSGQIEKEVPYHNSMEEGELLEYYQNGTIRTKQHYMRGQKNGASIGYFSNGTIAWVEEYAEGKILQGAYYSFEGDHIAQVRDGRGAQALYNQDSIAYLSEMHQGMPEGLVRKFNSKGEVIATYFLKNGKKQGEEIEYYLPPESQEWHPKLSIQRDKDTVHGCVKSWYPNGQLQSQREYCRNERLGPSCAWYKNGALMLVEEYESGHLTKGAYYKKNQNDPVSTIVNGKGIATLYDEDGYFLRKVTYSKGKPVEPDND